MKQPLRIARRKPILDYSSSWSRAVEDATRAMKPSIFQACMVHACLMGVTATLLASTQMQKSYKLGGYWHSGYACLEMDALRLFFVWKSLWSKNSWCLFFRVKSIIQPYICHSCLIHNLILQYQTTNISQLWKPSKKQPRTHLTPVSDHVAAVFWHVSAPAWRILPRQQPAITNRERSPGPNIPLSFP